MKKIIFFLCCMPGIFIVSLVALIVFSVFHWNQFDNLWWLPVVVLCLTVLTFLMNLYLLILGESVELRIQWAKWVGSIMISIMTLSEIVFIYIIQSQDKIESSEGYIIQLVVVESLCIIVPWAWFAFFFNMYKLKKTPV